MRQTERSREIRARVASRPIRQKKSRRKRTGSVLGAVALLFVVALAVAGAVAWNMLNQPAVDVAAGKPIDVLIESGSSTTQIAEQLAALGVVDNALMFRLQSRLADADGTLKAGEYGLSTGMPYELVLQKLAKGPDIVYFDVAIPEGFTAKQVAARFAAQAEIPEDEIMQLVTNGAKEFSADHPYLADAYRDSLEGFLFPATYRIKEGTSAHDVVEMLLDAFDEKLAEVDLAYAKSKNLDVNDIVIIASILERESKIKDEFPLVSSVIYNRLRKPMRLQLCATVLYELPEGTTKLTNDDLKLNSPYNTYLHDGLPAGPISNPGLAAIKAAAAPADTNYYYYVLTGKDGSQTFASTYDEFLKAKQVYKQVFGD